MKYMTSKVIKSGILFCPAGRIVSLRKLW